MMKKAFQSTLSLMMSLSMSGAALAQNGNAVDQLRSAIGDLGSLTQSLEREKVQEIVVEAIQDNPAVIDVFQANAKYVLNTSYKAFGKKDLKALEATFSEAAIEKLGGQEGLNKLADDLAARSETTVSSDSELVSEIGERTPEGTPVVLGVVISFLTVEVKDGEPVKDEKGIKGRYYEVLLSKEILVNENSTKEDIQNAIASREDLLVDAWAEQEVHLDPNGGTEQKKDEKPEQE